MKESKGQKEPSILILLTVLWVASDVALLQMHQLTYLITRR